MGARFNFNEAENYGQQNAGSFFTLKDDKDSAKVRFLYNTIDDVQGYVVHEVQIGDKTRYVGCLRAYNEPAEKCPFCKNGHRQIAKLYIKLFNCDTEEPQIWERSKAYFQRLASLAAHYNPLCNEVVEIERNGKKGDKQTQYQFYPVENSEFDISSVECSEPLGTIILDKTYEEMEEYLNTGEFPNDDGNSAPQRNEEVTRRTPQTSRRAF